MPLKDPAARRAYHRQWCARNKDRVRDYFKTWKAHPSHKASVLAAGRKWRKLNQGKANLAVRLYALRRVGVPESEIQKARIAVETFDGRCQICRSTSSQRRGKSFAIDHDHKTLRFRGILCHVCNSTTGLAKDNAVLLRQLADWIEGHSR